MEILERLFSLVFDKVPIVVAEAVLSILCFVFRPYRAVLRTVIFARRNKIPTPLFIALAFSLFMIACGFSRPFSAEIGWPELVKTISQIWTQNNKVDVFYVILYSFWLTTFVIFVHLCIEALTTVRSRTLFRDFYYVATAL
jgi:hypothetical protein